MASGRAEAGLDPVIVIFDLFLVLHIAAGAVGLVTFWLPVIGRKGSDSHKRWGRVFSWCIMTAGICAIAMSLQSLGWPIVVGLPVMALAFAVNGYWLVNYLWLRPVAARYKRMQRRRAEAGS